MSSALNNLDLDQTISNVLEENQINFSSLSRSQIDFMQNLEREKTKRIEDNSNNLELSSIDNSALSFNTFKGRYHHIEGTETFKMAEDQEGVSFGKVLENHFCKDNPDINYKYRQFRETVIAPDDIMYFSPQNRRKIYYYLCTQKYNLQSSPEIERFTPILSFLLDGTHSGDYWNWQQTIRAGLWANNFDYNKTMALIVGVGVPQDFAKKGDTFCQFGNLKYNKRENEVIIEVDNSINLQDRLNAACLEIQLSLNRNYMITNKELIKIAMMKFYNYNGYNISMKSGFHKYIGFLIGDYLESCRNAIHDSSSIVTIPRLDEPPIEEWIPEKEYSFKTEDFIWDNLTQAKLDQLRENNDKSNHYTIYQKLCNKIEPNKIYKMSELIEMTGGSNTIKNNMTKIVNRGFVLRVKKGYYQFLPIFFEQGEKLL